MATCLSHGGTAVYLSPSPSHEILIGTADGVLTLEREGSRQWRIARNSLQGCRVSSLMIEPCSGRETIG